MLIKFETNLLSFGLLLMLYQLMVRAAVIKPFNNSVTNQQKQEVLPIASANVLNPMIYPLMAPSPVDNSGAPYFRGPSNYPNGQYNQEPVPHSSHPQLRRGDEYPGDRRLPMEDPDYYYYADNPHYAHHPSRSNGRTDGNPRQQTPKKPKKIYKAIERVYYYPHSDSELARSKDALNQMKDFIPDEPNDEDPNDEQEQDEAEHPKDYGQMNDNPPRGEHEAPEAEEPEEVYASDGSGTQGSIAKDVKEFGREAMDEANKFDKFLHNLKNFADNSEKEYSSPSDGPDDDLTFQNSHDSDLGQKEDISDDNPRYADSMAAHTADDTTRDYETVSNFGNPDEYDSQRNSYKKQRTQMDRDQKGGHRYHKDRRRPRKSNSVPDEEYERRNREVSGLIDSEPEEGDYLSNFDVVKQMKNSEQKYNTGIDPTYSSKRDFDEVTRLEKMIENVALLNKQKEKTASKTHDRNEDQGREGQESNTKITKVAKKDEDKKETS